MAREQNRAAGEKKRVERIGRQNPGPSFRLHARPQLLFLGKSRKNFFKETDVVALDAVLAIPIGWRLATDGKESP